MSDQPINWEAVKRLYALQVARDPMVWRFVIYGKIADHEDACYLDLLARNSQKILDAFAALEAEGAMIERLRTALAAVGRPFRGGPNLCWCPESWSGPGHHTAACLQAFSALYDAPDPSKESETEGERDGQRDAAT